MRVQITLEFTVDEDFPSTVSECDDTLDHFIDKVDRILFQSGVDIEVIDSKLLEG